MQKQRGFSLIEMLVVAGLMIGLVMMMVGFFSSMQEGQMREVWVKQQAREMYMLAKAVEENAAKNSKTWTVDARVVVGVKELIDGGFLPQDFAKRMDSLGVTSVGVSPVGTRYNVAGIVTLEPVTNKRIARSVIWETGDPIAWGRYARIGLGQGTEPLGGLGINSKVQPVKLEVAKSLNADWKHPAPATIDAPGARAIGVLGGWTQSIAAYVGSGVLLPQPGVVILAGWPEFGSVLPQADPGGFTNFGECEVRPATCSGLELCQFSSSVPIDGACPAGEIELRRFEHCAGSGHIVGVPEIGGALTFGTYTVNFPGEPISTEDINRCTGVSGWDDASCKARAAEINSTEHNFRTIGTVTINSVNVKEYACQEVFWKFQPRSPPFTFTARNGPRPATDALCCLPPAE